MNLDDRLIDILTDGKLAITGKRLQIKQAFTDSGWTNRVGARGVAHPDGTIEPLLAGQEWFDRFEKELPKRFVSNNWENEIIRNTVAIMMEAAKKASGLK